MNVLSLFDGISCGQVALQRNNVKVNKYYASEIDKYAIQITQNNFPNTIQLGDIKTWINWKLDNIDLILAGSPCQGFSNADNGLNFNDPRSMLFFDFVDILKHYNPKYFILENVKMKREWQDIISSYVDVEPIEINSALVSAQNRKRLYWTNIPNVEQPKDKSILLKDIIECGYVDRDKSYCVDANYFKGSNLQNYFVSCRRQIVFEKPHGWNKGGVKSKDKFNTLRQCTEANYAILDNNEWRKLTPVECERLQTLPDDYTKGVSNHQRYKCLGNAWTVDVISHILSYS